MKMERANRVAVQVTGEGFRGSFYRTHKLIVTIDSANTDWCANEEANATTNRESYRNYLTEHAGEFGVDWNPSKSTQAWERKYNIYMDNEQVAEDAMTLLKPSIERLADKCRYDMVVTTMVVEAVTPKESTLTYVENGRYMKSGAWCVADIEVEIRAYIGDVAMDIVYNMEMKSGQICKPKTTIAEWNEIVARELELQGIVLEEQTA